MVALCLWDFAINALIGHGCGLFLSISKKFFATPYIKFAIHYSYVYVGTATYLQIPITANAYKCFGCAIQTCDYISTSLL